MKKTIQINISDKIYYIDEDAYNLLKNYLTQLADTFHGEDGKEIIGDIEGRVGELFTEKVESGTNVIDIDYVNQVIDIVGHPEEIDDNGENETQPQSASACVQPEPVRVPKKLFRNPRNRVFGGVIGGLAVYLGWDATIMRLLLVMLAIFTGIFPLLLIYLCCWMVIPNADTPRKQLEMMGEPVTIQNVGQNVRENNNNAENAVRSENPPRDALTTIFRFGGMLIMAVVGLIAALICLATFVCFVVCVYGLGYILLGNPADFGVSPAEMPDALFITGWLMSFCVAVFIPNLALFWASLSVIFNVRGASKGMIIAGVAIEVIAIFALVILTVSMATQGSFFHHHPICL